MSANLTLSTSTPTGVLPAAAHGVLTVVAMSVNRAVDLLTSWRQRAAAREHLLTLDEGLLRDIGLSRADVDIEASKPFWRE